MMARLINAALRDDDASFISLPPFEILTSGSWVASCTYRLSSTTRYVCPVCSRIVVPGTIYHSLPVHLCLQQKTSRPSTDARLAINGRRFNIHIYST
jgi:hypothetical protein